MSTDQSPQPRAAGAISPEPMGGTVSVEDRGPLARTIDVFIDNITAEHDLQVTDADQIRPYRFTYQNPRRFSLTSTFVF